jgi:PAS domain S-box-containing protein
LNTITKAKFPASDSETGKLIRSIDWRTSSLGPIENWSPTLITSINICLSSRFPMIVLWGSELLQFYNDAYGKIIGSKHPAAMGARCKDVWQEVWYLIGNVLEEDVFKNGRSSLSENQLMILNRKGYPEECYFTFSYSPIYSGDRIEGVFCAIQETTQEITNRKHLSILQSLSEHISDVHSVVKVFQKATEIFEKEIRDFPFTVIYKLNEESAIAERVCFSGIDKDHPVSATTIDLASNTIHAEMFHRLLTTEELLIYQHEQPVQLEDNFGTGIQQSLLFPIHQKEKGNTVAVIQIGVNPYLKLTEEYLHFFKLIVDQLEFEVNVSINILASKLAEKKLRESEDHYRLAIEVTQLATWDLNLQTFELTHSPRLAEILGYDPAKTLTHQMMHDHIHPEDLYPVVERAFDTALQTAAYNYDSRIIWPDKTLHWIRIQGKVLYDEKNIPSRMLGIMTDITELKNAEQALRESEKRFRIVADTAPVMIWMADRERNCIFLNKCWSEFTGIPISEGLRGGWTTVVHPDDLPGTSAKFSKAYETHTVYTQELRIRNNRGEYIWIMDHAVPRYSTEGFFLGYIGSSINIHEQKNAKEELEHRVIERTQELKKANEELRKTNKELEQFAYVSSHDLQEPLRKIQTFSQLLFNKIDETKVTERNYLQKISNSALRMSDLIRDLLNLSKLSNVDEEFRDTDLSLILENVKTDFEVLIKQKEAELQIQKLPVIHAIPIQMNQLFYNLISNALKFSEKPPVIQVSYSDITADELRTYNLQGEIKNEHYIKIKFVDNGIGFEQIYADQIFVIFQRLNDRSKFTGTGIGLAICKKIVENHNGFITVESKIDQGTTFHIFLPR